MKVVAYARVSTDEQFLGGAGLAAQRSAIEAACAARGYDLLRVYEDVASGGKLAGRPELAKALEAARTGEAEALVVAKLDRLSRSVHDFSGLLDRSRREGWSLVILDFAVDTTTPTGELAATTVAAAAQFERRMIGVRTREALAVRRAQGVKLGRPRQLPEDVVARIAAERKGGKTLQAIAETLNADGVPTAQGGQRWWPATVGVVLRYAEAA